ncbi:hypothetical protein [Ferrimonas pelagia]|uniref:Uncharacterized protein n=1 Tax=Ferrimonas pelagia TaxID=1177826 RepID=A0ABP9EDF2_9GAMM
MSDVFIIWRSPKTTMWEPVACLTHNDDKYIFNYTVGARDNDFPAFPRMTVKNKGYLSSELFPFF